MKPRLSKLDRIDPSSLLHNPRATQGAWLKYEPIILAAFKQHPRPYIFSPSSMSPVSVCSKARDAVRGKLAFDYPSEVSTPDLQRWYSEVIFKVLEESVYIGPPQTSTDSLEGQGNTKSSASSLSFSELSFEEISAWALLISNGRFKGSVTVLYPPDLSLLPPRPNVEMMSKPDGSLVLL